MKKLILLSLLISSLSVISANKYVAKTGNDSNAGTLASPYLTITKGLSVVAAGDTVFVKVGTYSEYVQIPASGTAGHPIVLKNFGTDVVTVSGEGSRVYGVYADDKNYWVVDGINTTSATSANVKITGCSYATVKNCSATSAVNANSTVINVKLVPSATHWNTNITIDNVTGYGGQYGMYLEEKQNTINILNSHFSYAAWDGFNAQISWVEDTTQWNRYVTLNNVEVDHNSRQGLVTLNLIKSTFSNFYAHHNGATGFQVEDGCSLITLQDFLSENNSQSYAYETGIWVDDAINITVRRGIMRNNGTGFRCSYSTGVLAYNLIIYSNQNGTDDGNLSAIDCSNSRIEIYNNTIYGNSKTPSNRGGVCLRDTGRYVLKNNIFACDSSAYDIFNTGTHTLISDYNLIYNTRTISIYNGSGATTWAGYKSATGQDSHSINTNPLFSGTYNFVPTASSPAINAGTNTGITTDYLGHAREGNYDIGAYEYNTGTEPPDPPEDDGVIRSISRRGKIIVRNGKIVY